MTHHNYTKNLSFRATQLMMDRLVLEGLLRLMPPHEKLRKFFILTFMLLAWLCVYLVNEVKTLGATYGLVQMLRMLAIAHVLRFVQSRIYKVPSAYYLQKVLKSYDLPITAVISASYTIFRIFPSPPVIVLLPALFVLLRIILTAPKQRMGVEQVISSSSSNDIQVIDHFATILLAVICVDIVVELEKLEGTYKLFSMVLVLASRHIPYFIKLGKGDNNVPLASYLRNVLPYDLQINAAIYGFYIIIRLFSISLFLAFCIEFTLLALTKRDELITNAKMLLWNFYGILDSPFKQWKRLKHDISPTQAPSSITKSVHQPDFSKWVRGDHIGSGQFGNVYVYEHSETKEKRAVKELNIRANENDKSTLQEVEILSQLEHHQNIIKYYGHDIDEQGHISLHMEYIEQGSLYDYMKKRGKRSKLDEPLIRDFTSQILYGMLHLHRYKAVHRDIKPENLLVDSMDIVKLVDFGLSKTLAISVGQHSVKGTLNYAAPELLKGQEYQRGAGFAADVWSLGCVIVEMFTGELPQWPLYDRPHPPIPEGLSENGKDFLRRCFKTDPAERPSAAELLHHRFVI